MMAQLYPAWAVTKAVGMNFQNKLALAATHSMIRYL